MNWHAIQFGPLSTWFAVLAAIIAASFAYATHRREHRRDMLRELKEDLEQADKIGVWLAPRGLQTYSLAVSNASNLPVYDMFVSISLANGVQLLGISFDVLPPSPDTQHKPLPESANQKILQVLVESNPWESNIKPYRIVARFRDARGFYWRRDADGKLELLA